MYLISAGLCSWNFRLFLLLGRDLLCQLKRGWFFSNIVPNFATNNAISFLPSLDCIYFNIDSFSVQGLAQLTCCFHLQNSEIPLGWNFLFICCGCSVQRFVCVWYIEKRRIDWILLCDLLSPCPCLLLWQQIKKSDILESWISAPMKQMKTARIVWARGKEK